MAPDSRRSESCGRLSPPLVSTALDNCESAITGMLCSLAIFLAIVVSSLEILNVNLEISNLIIFASVCWILIIGLLLYVFIIKVFETNSDSIHRIQGGIASYLLIGLLFAFVFYLIYNLSPLSFSFNDSFSTSEMLFYDFIYRIFGYRYFHLLFLANG